MVSMQIGTIFPDSNLARDTKAVKKKKIIYFDPIILFPEIYLKEIV